MPDKHDEQGCFGAHGKCRCEGIPIYYDDVMDHPPTKLIAEKGFGVTKLTLEGCTCKHMLMEHDTSACWHKGCFCVGRVIRDVPTQCCECACLEDTFYCNCVCHAPTTTTCCNHPDTYFAALQCNCGCHSGTRETETDNVAAAILAANKELEGEALIRRAQERIASERP